MLERNRGIGPGFDFLRVALALSVVFYHEQGEFTATPHIADNPFEQMFGDCILPMFFGLSGFLITGSALRLKLKDFLINRGMRIFPALAVEITLSAFILGPIFTELTIGQYFSNGLTYHYLTNIIGRINYLLPGVFQGNPSPTVNVSLWTIPFELGCYIVMSGLIALRLLYRPRIIGVGFTVFTAISLLFALAHADLSHLHIPITIGEILYGRGNNLYIAFTLGILCFLCRSFIPYTGRGALACCAVLLAVCFVPGKLHDVAFKLAVLPAVTYLVAFIGVSPLFKLPIFHRGDYSYGIYLYGAVIQQAVRAALPRLGAVTHFSVSIVLITVFAIFSWHVIEKPILGLRKRFSFVAKQRGVIETAPARTIIQNK